MSWTGSPWMGGGSGGGGSGVGPMAASALADAARRKHPAFSETAIPWPVVAAELSDLQMTLHQLAQQRDPYYVTATVTWPLQPFVASRPLPDHAGVAGGRVTLLSPVGAFDEFYVVTRPSRLRTPRRWCGRVENQTLTLIGDATYWQPVASLDVEYAPVPAPITVPGDLCILPASARAALVAGLAATMAVRAAALGIPGVDVAGAQQTAAALRGAWLDTVGGVGRARPVLMGSR